MIKTDVIDIAALLSRASMKPANMNLKFKEDTTSVFDEKIYLVATKSGHYAFYLTIPCSTRHKQQKCRL